MRAKSITLGSVVAVVIAGTLSTPVRAEGIAAWIASVGQMLSATKVAAKQVELSKSRRDQMAMDASKAKASAEIDMYNRRKVREVLEQYGVTSQLVDPCYQIAMAKSVTSAVGSASFGAQAAMQAIYATDSSGYRSAGGVLGALGKTNKATSMPFASTVAARIARHTARYCTVSEAQAGLCSLNANGMQGADADFSMLAVPGKTWGWNQTEAGIDFVKTLVPVKVVPKASDCTDPACISALAERRQQEAYLSLARFSMMRFAESRSTPAGADGKKGS